VKDSTTVGEVITELYNKFGISTDKQIYFLYNANRFDYKTSDTTLFKNLSFKPNNTILVMQQ
jgi:DNA polymerase III delta subunit